MNNPRPWKWVDLRHQKNGQIRIFDEKYQHIANVLAANPDCAEKAATIVKAMNNLRRIAEIIEDVDRRCEAYDGPVGDTREEMTAEEMRELYQLARITWHTNA